MNNGRVDERFTPYAINTDPIAYCRIACTVNFGPAGDRYSSDATIHVIEFVKFEREPSDLHELLDFRLNFLKNGSVFRHRAVL